MDPGTLAIPVEQGSEDYISVTYALRLALGCAQLDDVVIYKMDNPQTRATFEETKLRSSEAKDSPESKPIDVWVNTMDLDEHNRLPDVQKRGLLVIPPGLPVLAGHIPIETETPVKEGSISKRRHGREYVLSARQYSFLLSSLHLGRETAVDSVSAADFDKFKKDGQFMVPDGFDTLYVHTEKSGIPSIEDTFRRIASSLSSTSPSVAGGNQQTAADRSSTRSGVSHPDDTEDAGLVGLGGLKDSHLYITRSSNSLFPRYLVSFSLDPSLVDSIKRSAGMATDRDKLVPQCGVCGERKSSVYCVSDQEFFCAECDASFHKNRIAAKHKRIPAVDYLSSSKFDFSDQGAQSGGLSVPLCKEHKKQLDYFDVDLGVPICVDCKMFGSHSKGRYSTNTLVPVASIYEQCLNELEEESRDLTGSGGGVDGIPIRPERTIVSGLMEEFSSSVQSIDKRMRKLYSNYKSCEKKLEIQFQKLRQQLIDVVRTEFIYYYISQLEARRRLTTIRNEARLPGLLLTGGEGVGVEGTSDRSIANSTLNSSMFGGSAGASCGVGLSPRKIQGKKKITQIDPVALIEIFRGRQISLANLQFESPSDIRSWAQDVVNRGEVGFSGSLSITAGDNIGSNYNFDYIPQKPYGMDDDEPFYGSSGGGYDTYDNFGFDEKRSVRFRKSLLRGEGNRSGADAGAGTGIGDNNYGDGYGGVDLSAGYMGGDVGGGVLGDSGGSLRKDNLMPSGIQDFNIPPSSTSPHVQGTTVEDHLPEMKQPKGGVPFEMKKPNQRQGTSEDGGMNMFDTQQTNTNTNAGDTPYLYNVKQQLQKEIENAPIVVKSSPKPAVRFNTGANTRATPSTTAKTNINTMITTTNTNISQLTPRPSIPQLNEVDIPPLAESPAQNNTNMNVVTGGTYSSSPFAREGSVGKGEAVEYILSSEQKDRLSKRRSTSAVPGDKFTSSRSTSLSPSTAAHVIGMPISRSSSAMRVDITPITNNNRGSDKPNTSSDRSNRPSSSRRSTREVADGESMPDFAESKRQIFLKRNPGHHFTSIPFDESEILKNLDSLLRSMKQPSQDVSQNILLVKQMLYFCLPFRIPVVTHLIFSTIVQEPNIRSFLGAVEKKGSTLLLMSAGGTLFGGFASTNWDVDGTGKPFGSSKCFLFKIGILVEKNSVELSIRDSKYYKCIGEMPLCVTKGVISFGRDLIIRDGISRTPDGSGVKPFLEYECKLGTDYNGHEVLGRRTNGRIDVLETFNFTD